MQSMKWLCALCLLALAVPVCADPSISPVGAVVTPGHSVQFSVVGLPEGVSVSVWQGEDVDPPNGLQTYIPYTDNSAVYVNLSNGGFLQCPFTLSPNDADYNPGTSVPPPPPANATPDTGTPDQGIPDTGVFNGTIGPMTNDYLTHLIHNFGIPAIFVSFAVCAWMLLRRYVRGVAK